MADTKISGLAAVSAFATTHEYVVNDGLVSRKITGAQILAAVPQGTLPSGYAQVVAAQGTYTAITDLTGLSVTVAITAGRRIRITGYAPQWSSVATDTVALLIRESGTTLQFGEFAVTGGGQQFGSPLIVILTPSAGSHTYNLSGQRIAGTGNITMQAGTTVPAFIHVEDVGV